MKFIDVFREDEPSKFMQGFVDVFVKDIIVTAKKRNQQVSIGQLLFLLELFRSNMNKLNRKCVVRQIQFHCMRLSMEAAEEGYIKFTLRPVDQSGRGVLPEKEDAEFYLFVTEEERQELEKRKGDRVMLSLDPENKNNPN